MFILHPNLCISESDTAISLDFYRRSCLNLLVSLSFTVACRCSEQTSINLTLHSQVPDTKPFSEISDGAGGLKYTRVEVSTIKERGWKKSINTAQEQDVFSYNTQLAAILKVARANRKPKQNSTSSSDHSSSSRPSSSNTVPLDGKSLPETSNQFPSSLSPLQVRIISSLSSKLFKLFPIKFPLFPPSSWH